MQGNLVSNESDEALISHLQALDKNSKANKNSNIYVPETSAGNVNSMNPSMLNNNDRYSAPNPSSFQRTYNTIDNNMNSNNLNNMNDLAFIR